MPGTKSHAHKSNAASEPTRALYFPVIYSVIAVGQPVYFRTGIYGGCPAPVVTGIQWLLDGNPIAGATGATYTPKATDVGINRLSVRETAGNVFNSVTNTSPTYNVDGDGSGPIGGVVGVNVAGMEYYGTPNLLVNMLSQGHGAFLKASTTGFEACAVDGSGWPTEDPRVIPHNLAHVYTTAQDCLGSFTGYCSSITITHNDNSRYSIVAGPTYDGVTNTTTFTVRAAASTGGAGVDNFNVQFNGTGRTGPGTAPGLTNLVLAHPGYSIADITNKVWTDEAVAYYQLWHGPLRVMDLLGTNFSTLVNWSDVPLRATRHTGPTFDDAIDLANRCNRNLHWQVPHLFTDAAVQAMGDFGEARLNTGLSFITGYSNELWNPAFGQYVDTLTFACVELKAFVGGLTSGYSGSRDFTATRLSNVVTITTAMPHQLSTGDQPYFTSFDGFNPNGEQSAAITVTSPTTFTFARAGADGTVTVTGSHWFVGNLNSTLRFGATIGADNNVNVFQLANRWRVRRLKEISDLLRGRPTIGDSKMGSRWRMVWEDQMAANPDDFFADQPLDYLAAAFPNRAVDDYLWGWFGAPYFFPYPFGETAGATQAQVIGALQNLLGQDGTDARTFYHIEKRKAKALSLGRGLLVLGCYEGGPDTKSNTLNGADLGVRCAAQFDPGMYNAALGLLNACFGAGYGPFNWFTGGFLNATDQNRDVVWGVTDRFSNTTTPKLQAFSTAQNTNINPSRNVVPATLDGRTCFVDNYSGTSYQNLQDFTGHARVLVYCSSACTKVRIKYTCNLDNRAANIYIDATPASGNPYQFSNQGTGVTHASLRTTPGPAQLADITVSWAANTWHAIDLRRTTGQGDDVEIFSVQVL